jgi:hypothetical protein
MYIFGKRLIRTKSSYLSLHLFLRSLIPYPRVSRLDHVIDSTFSIQRRVKEIFDRWMAKPHQAARPATRERLGLHNMLVSYI